MQPWWDPTHDHPFKLNVDIVKTKQNVRACKFYQRYEALYWGRKLGKVDHWDNEMKSFIGNIGEEFLHSKTTVYILLSLDKDWGQSRLYNTHTC